MTAIPGGLRFGLVFAVLANSARWLDTEVWMMLSVAVSTSCVRTTDKCRLLYIVSQTKLQQRQCKLEHKGLCRYPIQRRPRSPPRGNIESGSGTDHLF